MPHDKSVHSAPKIINKKIGRQQDMCLSKSQQKAYAKSKINRNIVKIKK